MDESTPEVRIGDRERREADARLQQAYADGVLTMSEYEERSAQAWAARTRSELAPLVLDLPEPEPEPETPAGPPPGPVRSAAKAVAGNSTLRKRVAGGLAALLLLGVGVYGGSQAVGAEDGVQVFGDRVVPVGIDDDELELGVVFGDIEVRVPDDVRVRPGGSIIFGDLECGQACDGPGTREVVVEANGIFGDVTIVRPGEDLSNDNDNDNDNDN